ncbi:phospho-N-acetylmuramoyl-pentapeptide-transferase [Candidatus Kuenenbacteria bacterium HGW-Kuenenbacteria-1]|uniref:Phospho-N-acetylmuramoyl-pentapeptide-transferase n=1 Tax=Candidatus Kuenenbacteria bacterium HGW-Kuenenbacteria-1 TaxID=2013812 RepID=A0A2N1UPC6_9BACT|nr:MAG: phospho-N-acetylmuramoyl-pentapeptide-transferase [Candidatus Kuenenbacteria bacterium HGW-Kuenenbacteria-1]
MEITFFPIIKIFFLSTLSFLIALIWVPFLISFLNKNKLKKNIRESVNSPIFSKMHRIKSGTPTMGGILIWGTTLIVALLFSFLAKFTLLPIFEQLNFLTRPETLLPLGALIASALVGLGDDFLNIKKIGPNGGGLKVAHRLIIYTLIAGLVACFGAWWFYYKLEWSIIYIPFLGHFNIGFWYIPLFIFIIVSTAFSVNETDGLDGLAGGILLFSFITFGFMAFILGKVNLAAFCGVISGALLSFLWFNVYPAKFFMGDTGAMSLGITLGVVAMLTNTFLFLPIVGFLFIIESLSVIIQMLSKKIRHKKIFLSSPIHHHLEAKGWPEPQIVMRFWIIAGVSAIIGLIIFLLDKGI